LTGHLGDCARTGDRIPRSHGASATLHGVDRRPRTQPIAALRYVEHWPYADAAGRLLCQNARAGKRRADAVRCPL